MTQDFNRAKQYICNLLNKKISPSVFACLKIPEDHFTPLAITLQFLCLKEIEISAENIYHHSQGNKALQVAQYMDICNMLDKKEMFKKC